MTNPFTIDEVSLNAICSRECPRAELTLRRDIPRSILLKSMGLGEDISRLCMSFLGSISPLESLNLRCEDVCLHTCIHQTQYLRDVESTLELQKRARDLVTFLNNPLSDSLLRHTIRQGKKLTIWGSVAVWWILRHTLDACAMQAGASERQCELAKHEMNVHLSCATIQPIYKTMLRCYVDECRRKPNLNNRKIESVSHCCYLC